MKRKVKVYLSGRITGLFDYEKRFAEEEIIVKRYFGDKVKVKIINPVKLGKRTERKCSKYFIPKKPTWSEYMKDCVKELPKCDYVWMLEGWMKSRGARIEYQLAHDLNITVMDLDKDSREDYRNGKD